MRNSADWPFPSSPSPMIKAAMYAGAAVGLFLLYKLVTTGVRGTAAAVTSGVIDAGAGVVIGAGEAIGIPQTNANRCAEAMYEGRTWDASFDCPAGTFLRYVFGATPPPPSPGLNGLPSRRLARRRLNRNC